MKNLLVYKIIILIIGFVSLFLLYTGDIYMYENLSIKFLSPSLWCGIGLWILFLINAIILTIKMNKNENDKFLKLRNIFRNIVLLVLITILLVYKMGNGVLNLYKVSHKNFNMSIYIVFAITFVSYLITTIIINRKEDNEKLNKKNTKTKKNKKN